MPRNQKNLELYRFENTNEYKLIDETDGTVAATISKDELIHVVLAFIIRKSMHKMMEAVKND